MTRSSPESHGERRNRPPGTRERREGKAGQYATCRECSARWTGMARCHCGACHETFTGITAFDAHRRAHTCRNPADAGLVRRDGYWGNDGDMPAGLWEVQR